MSSNSIDVVYPVVTFYGSLGELTDANGTVVEDTVATVTWESSDGTVAISSASTLDAIDAVFTVTGNGTTSISVSGTTAAGNTVTGSGQAIVTGYEAAPGPAVNVAVNLTVDAPTTTPTPVPTAPAPAATIGGTA